MTKSLKAAAAVALAAGLLLGSCSSSTATDDTLELTSVAGVQEIVESPPAHLVVLDIRTPEEFAAGHLADAVNIDYYADDFEDQLEQLDPEVPYVMYCNSGNRSSRALPVMDTLGFAEVYELEGGIQAWYSAGLPVERSARQPGGGLRWSLMQPSRFLSLLLLLAACSPQPDNATAASSPDPAVVVTAGATPSGTPAEVVRVFDGDSLLMTLDGGAEVEVRLLGVNAPEGSECHGDAARATLERLVQSGQVYLVEDGADTDQFDRLLRYLYVEDLNINLAMIANGDAIALQGDHSLDSEFTEIADAAAAEGIGMWAPDACGDTAPPRSMSIVDYVYNPAGRDTDNRNGEWVAVTNEGPEPVDMSEWVLRDESTQHRYRFPNGFALDSGATVIVHSGCGDDSNRDLHWCAGDPVWSNGGDTIILHLPSGTVVARDRYDGDF